MAANQQALDWNPWGRIEEDVDPWRDDRDSRSPQRPDTQQASWTENPPVAPKPASSSSTAAHSAQANILGTPPDPWSQLGAVDWNDSRPVNHQQSPSKLHQHISENPAPQATADPWDEFERIQSTARTHPQQASVTGMQVTVPVVLQTPVEDPWDHFERSQTHSKPAVVDPLNASSEQHVWPFVPQRTITAQDDTRREVVRRKSRSPRPPRDENVLFDAENMTDTDEEYAYGDYDDFGDFETGAEDNRASASEVSRSTAQIDQPSFVKATGGSLLDLDDLGDLSPALSAEATSFKSSRVRVKPWETPNAPFDPFSSLEDVSGRLAGLSMPSSQQTIIKPRQATNTETSDPSRNVTHPAGQAGMGKYGGSPKILQPQNGNNDQSSAWETWDDDDTPTTGKSTAFGKNYFGESTRKLPPLLNNNVSATSRAPPTNMPPPALLLSLFPPLLNAAQTELFDHLHDFATAHQTRALFLSNPTTQIFIGQHLTVATVLARVIAGRKLRWKRDTLLSQSMRIGQASSGGGLKLASIDKAENAREEREVENVVRLWKAQLGKLKSALVGAGLSTAIPDIAEVLPVRTAPTSEGAVTAPRQCAFCALKRNERVPKVDIDVQDAFGEWWIEHWGHNDCKLVWETYEKDLRSR